VLPCPTVLLAADREAEARAAVAPARRPVRLLERLEDEAQVVLGNADARVRDRERHDCVGLRERLARELPPFGELDPQRDLPFLGELERVRQQVLEDLLQPLLVRLDRRRDVRTVHLDLERELLVLRDGAERPLDELAEVAELHVGHVHVHASRFDLREVEDVVDQVEEIRARAVDRVRELDLLLREVAVRILLQQLREDEQRVERRAQLVRHVREELGLVA